MIWFKVNHAAFQMEAGLIYCGLRIHPHIQHVHQHLHYGGAEALTSGASQGNNFSRCLLGRFGPGPVSAACDGGAIMDVSLSPGGRAKKPSGFRSSSPIMLFSMIPVPGTTMPEPDPQEEVTETAIPAASTTET